MPTAQVFEQVTAQALPPPTTTAQVLEQVMPKNPEPTAAASRVGSSAAHGPPGSALGSDPQILNLS